LFRSPESPGVSPRRHPRTPRRPGGPPPPRHRPSARRPRDDPCPSADSYTFPRACRAASSSTTSAARNASRDRSCEPFLFRTDRGACPRHAYWRRRARRPLLIARAYGATASIAFPIPGRPGGLADEKCRTWPALGRMHAMSQTKDFRDTVERELSYDPLVDNSDISVKNVDGDVALNGTVPSYPQYLEAAAAARRVAGVTATANDALTLGHTEPAPVQATAKNGDITLSGAVRCAAEQAAAEAMIADLTGVRSVTNNIQIRDDADPV